MSYETVIRDLIYPAFQILKGRSTMELLRFWEELHLKPREEIDRYQSERLKAIFHHAYENIPFYRDRFIDCGIRPGDINKVEDFANIPPLLKEEVRMDPEKFTAPGYDHGLETVRTGGSTGEPMKYFMGQDAFAANQAAIWRSRRWFGMDIGQPHILIWGHSASFQGVMQAFKSTLTRPVKDLLLNRRTLSAYNLSEKQLGSYINTICDHKPNYMRGYASTFFVLANYIEEHGSGVSLPTLKGIISTSEVLYDWQRNLIERVFHCPVVNEYGSNESGVMAYSCPAGNLHVMEENVYLEIIKEDGAGPQDPGEIVVTQLHHRGAPLLRYRIGDVATGIHQGCPCGSNLKVLDGLIGRTYDLIVTPDGRFVHGQLFHHILRQPEYIRKFQVIQKNRSRLLIKLVSEGQPKSDQKAVIRRQIINEIGKGMKISIDYVREIPREKSGKYRWIISEISHQMFRDRVS